MMILAPYIYEYVIRTTEFKIRMKNQNEILLTGTQICIYQYVIRTTELIMGLSSETPRVPPPPDKVGDLPLWTARGVGNSLYNFSRA